MSAEASTTSLVDTVVSRCPKCGVNKKGQPNCCARGGAWFGKCGLEGDTNFDHTWDEGLKVCEHEILSGVSEAKSKKFEELQTVGSYEQNVSRWTSTASPIFEFSDSDIERRANGQFNARLVEIVVIISMLFDIILSKFG